MKIRTLIIFLLIFLITYAYSFEFAVLGDSRAEGGAPLVFESLLEKISKTNAEFIIHLGDFLNNSDPKEYEFLKRQISKTKLPIYFVPGNHDIKGDMAVKAFKDFTGKPLYYYFDYKNARFIILNNAFGKLGEEQINWLIEVLRSAKGKYKFVFMHQPVIAPNFFLSFHKADPSESKRLMKIFEEEKVNYVFAGHIHMYYRKVINKVVYIISGVAGASPYVSPETINGKPHFILIKVTDDGIEDKMIPLEN
ncbi:MAG: hypothetical protein CBR30_07385 [Dictyoglomus sp. NZ13-RE01]|nr:MAG: hypothetical protein CBR30_07385 [Dictyoglomus sp. NZ13-RE01]